MPKRPRMHIVEDLARAQLHQAFAGVGWTSEDLDKDYGEDVLVRIFEDEATTPWSFFIQSKATDSLDRYLAKDGRTISYPIYTTHLEHWKRFWEPVLLAIYDASTKRTYWEVIQTYLESRDDSHSNKSGKTVSVHIPTDNLLDINGIQRIKNRTKRRFKRFEAQKEGAEVLLEELRNKWEVDIEYGPETGILMLPKGKFQRDSSGGYTLIAFGKYTADIDRLKNKYGIEPKEVFDQSIDLMSQIATAYKDGAKIQVRDKDGTVTGEWKSLKELLRHTNRQAELDSD